MGLAPTRTDGPFARSVARSHEGHGAAGRDRDGVAVGREIGSRRAGLAVGEVREVAHLRVRPLEVPEHEDVSESAAEVVEVMGLEPTASSMRPKRSSQLSYTPAGRATLAEAAKAPGRVTARP